MTEKTLKPPGYNLEMPVIEVKHSELERADSSPYRSMCPSCGMGRLLIYRDNDTGILLAEDCCIYCGQRFYYLDIDNLRSGKL